MKTIKRLLLKVPYYLYWFLTALIYNVEPLRFNGWLSKHGFWRLTTTLGNFKVIVPKQYYDFVKKYPQPKYILGIDPLSSKPESNKVFYHWEGFGDIGEGSEGIIAQVKLRGAQHSYSSENTVSLDDMIAKLEKENGPTELPPQ